ncbi:MAG TPA: M28 family peptidase [Gemmatimonadaceae bacterium]|nr:M28 family peptidase [Gemmatimonadaceae bacterium]
MIRTVAVVLVCVSLPSRAVAQSVMGCSTQDFLRTVAALSADSMEGRRPGTAGAERAAAYIATAFRAAGLTSPSGDFRQRVPLVMLRTTRSSLTIRGPRRASLTTGDSGVTITSENTSDVRITGVRETVYVGYGIHAPDAGHDDFDGVDLRGRIVVMRSGAPDSARLKLPWGRDDVRATDPYKLAVLRSRGAAGAVFLMSGKSLAPEDREVLTLPRANALDLVAWLDSAASVRFAVAAGFDAASIPAPRATRSASLERVSFETHQEVAQTDAANIVGLIPGRSADAETVLYTAHYDHLGVRHRAGQTDSIYNGALDNAAGVSALICLARRFEADKDSLRRSIVLLATTAEEHSGHPGSAWYVEHPVVPLARTVVALNIDGINTLAPTDDYMVLPGSLVDDVGLIATAGTAAGMTLSAASFERGMDWSFDTEAFNRRGIPALTIWQGFRGRGMTPQDFFRLSRARNATYHTPFDTLSTAWSSDAIEQHLRLLREVGLRFAMASSRPRLQASTPFSIWPVIDDTTRRRN